MSVDIEEVVSHAGYDFEGNIEDAKWLIAQIECFGEMCEKARDFMEIYDEYEWWLQERDWAIEDNDGVETKETEFKTFEEWKKEIYNAK